MYKHDYEPVLNAGRHEMTAEEFEAKFVVGLGGTARRSIWNKVRTDVIEEIRKHNIACELWIDGSFITRCPDPNDIDGSIMVLCANVDVADDDAVEFLYKFDDMNHSADPCLDIFLCQIYPEGHPMWSDQDPISWSEQWSRERNSDWLKGFVVIPFRQWR